jgi:DNA/RNA-binding protein KIN17
MSESHQRQLLLFGENSGKFLDEFSRDFSNGYVNTLRRRFGTKRTHSNIVYQEYIRDRDHIHMNATKWLTLTDYVKYLGRIGICVVDETEKGWFVTYIDRDPETLRRQEEAEKKVKLDLDDRQRQEMYLEKQMERAKEREHIQVAEPTELKKSEDEVIKISFIKKRSLVKLGVDEPTTSKKSKEDDEEKKLDFSSSHESQDELETNEEELPIKKEKVEKNEDSKSEFKFKIPEVKSSSSKSSSSSEKTVDKKKQSALDEIITVISYNFHDIPKLNFHIYNFFYFKQEEKTKEKMNRKDYWLHKVSRKFYFKSFEK